MAFHTENTTLHVGRWSITGISVGGTHTTIVINELKICFDIGVLTNASVHCDKILISHGHVDHCQSFFKHCRSRKLQGMLPKPIYFVPPVLEKPMLNSARAQFNMEKGLDNVPMPEDFIEVQSMNAETPVAFNQCNHSTCYLYAYPMSHRIPAYGYSVVSEVPKLKDEYLNLSRYQIKVLKESGANIFWTKRTIELAYTGDTTIEGVLRQPDFLNAQVLLIECTIIDNQVDRQETFNRGHIHIQDIIDNWTLFNNEHIVLFHLSPRYVGIAVHKLVAELLKPLPADFVNRVQLLWPKSG